MQVRYGTEKFLFKCHLCQGIGNKKIDCFKNPKSRKYRGVSNRNSTENQNVQGRANDCDSEALLTRILDVSARDGEESANMDLKIPLIESGSKSCPAFLMQLERPEREQKWYIDCRATAHLRNELSHFSEPLDR